MQEYKLQINVEGTKIVCTILGNTHEREFAFYLKVNNVKIDTRWYEPSNTCIFSAPTETFKIIGFIKDKDKEVTALISDYYAGVDNVAEEDAPEEIYEANLRQYTVSIFGSCVSRDLLEFRKQNNFGLKQYFARCSIVSAVSSPIVVVEQEISLDSKFQKRQVMADLDKRMWRELERDKPDYLMVDFIDERFPSGKCGNSYFTLSNEMVQSGYVKDYKVIERKKISSFIRSTFHKDKKNVFVIDNRSIEKWLDVFWDRVLRIYQADKIILHEAKMADDYYDEDGEIKRFSENYLEHNKKINELLEYMYNYSKRKLKNCISISVDSKRYATCQHKWGLAPMHYTNEYYYGVLDEISNKIVACEK